MATIADTPTLPRSLSNAASGKEITCRENLPTKLTLPKDADVEKKSLKRGRPTYTVELLPAKNIFALTVLPQGSKRTK